LANRVECLLFFVRISASQNRMLDESLHIRLYLAFYRNAIDFTSTAARGGYDVEELWRYKRGVTLKRVRCWSWNRAHLV